MARPRILPEYNPSIPAIFLQHYPKVVEKAQKCIEATGKGDKFCSLLWLKAYNLAVKHIVRHKAIENFRQTHILMTLEERNALEWLRHKGKWAWEVSEVIKEAHAKESNNNEERTVKQSQRTDEEQPWQKQRAASQTRKRAQAAAAGRG